MSAAADQSDNPDEDKNGGNNLHSQSGTHKRKGHSFTCPICKKTFSSRSDYLQHGCFSSSLLDSNAVVKDGEGSQEKRENARSVKKKKALSKEEEEEEKSRFECQGCKKVFNSSRALEGHRSTCKRVKEYSSKSSQVEEELSAPLKKLKMKSPKKYICTTCGEECASGPALGRHKRTHSSANQDRGIRLSSLVRFRLNATSQAPPPPPLLPPPSPPPPEDCNGAGSSVVGSRPKCEGLDADGVGSSVAWPNCPAQPCLESRVEGEGLNSHLPVEPEDGGAAVSSMDLNILPPPEDEG